MSIGIKVRKLRELKNVTQEYMSQQLGISQNAYSKLEREETDVPFSRLEQIAKVLDIDILDIVGFDEKRLFFRITKNKDNSNNGLIINTGISEKEKQMYEQLLSQLREENEYLKKILDSYVK
jgi:transcriptional regulator with XRE-family HTH domain